MYCLPYFTFQKSIVVMFVDRMYAVANDKMKLMSSFEPK
jgi:hypothetical protein